MLPFSDIRVVDFTHVIAGPFCAHQLAVLGAEVIKIEPPAMPDMVRYDGGDHAAVDEGMASVFLGQASNKRTVAIDLKSEEGRAIVLSIIEKADVVIENYRSDALASLGLGYEDAKAVNPRIIYCSLTGFGQTGPKAQHTAYDNVIQAFSGLMAATGSAQSGPMKVGPPVLDYGTGAQAALAIAASLFKRERTGEGEYIDISMLDAALMLMGANVTYFHKTGELLPRSGNSSHVRPGYGCYETEDGMLMIGAYTIKQHADLFRTIGHFHRAAELDFATNPRAVSEKFDSDANAIAVGLLMRTADEWETLLNEAKVPAARVRTLDETLAHPQIASRSVLQTPQDENGEDDGIALPTAAYRFSNSAPQIGTAPAKHGAHTREVLLEFGLSDARIAELAALGVIAADD